ncbi:MAG TPA: preprotein translocase subunit SecY [Armatimonadota bacterium]|jgi:preprotein translocase subunit SecY
MQYVLFALALQVVAIHVPVPGISGREMDALLTGKLRGALGLLDLFSGGALKNFSVTAMGILPYINASIVMQLLTVAVPSLEKMAKEGGESGRKEINKYTRMLTLALAIFQGTLLCVTLRSQGGLFVGISGFMLYLKMFQIVLAITAGTAFLLWLGESITEKGIGNGVSIIIFGNIMVRLPSNFGELWALYVGGTVSILQIAALVVTFVAVTAIVVAMVQAVRKVPVQHARRVVGGGKVTAGGSTFLPFKVNSSGVMPIIFAMALLALPATLGGVAPGKAGEFFATVARDLQPGLTVTGILACLVYTIVIMGFTYFYTAVMMNIPEMSDNLKKWNAFIPGIRPGKDTTAYLDRVMTRITLAGAIFLSGIALVQYLAPAVLRIPSGAFSLYGGTSLLIVVGVALETMQAIEAQLMMRHYEGFIK